MVETRKPSKSATSVEEAPNTLPSTPPQEKSPRGKTNLERLLGRKSSLTVDGMIEDELTELYAEFVSGPQGNILDDGHKRYLSKELGLCSRYPSRFTGQGCGILAIFALLCDQDIRVIETWAIRASEKATEIMIPAVTKKLKNLCEINEWSYRYDGALSITTY